MKQTPYTMNESVTEPPVIFLIPISSLLRSSLIDITASTTILPKNCFYLAIILELSEVYAHFSRSSRFSASDLSPILTETSLMRSRHILRAIRYPLMMIWECMPSSMKVLDCFNSSPAVSTTEVVPSPTWLS